MVNKIRDNIADRYRAFGTRGNLNSLFWALLFFAAAVMVHLVSDNYVTRVGGTAVNDVILSHVPTLDIDPLIVIGSLIVTFAVFFFILYRPKYLNFGLKSLALFVIIRSIMISLTHLGANPHELVLDSTVPGFQLYNLLYNTSNDFFFSGHTGIPFLLGLIFWPERPWREFYFIASAVFGVSVLVGHIHYSIDVAAAPFMAYSIYALSIKLFPKDYKLTQISD